MAWPAAEAVPLSLPQGSRISATQRSHPARILSPGNGGTGLIDAYRTGIRAGLLRLRHLRPFPAEELQEALFGEQRTVSVKAVAVLEKDISFGHQGSVAVEVKAALYEYAAERQRIPPKVLNFVAGLGGQDVTQDHVGDIFAQLAENMSPAKNRTRQAGAAHFLGLETYVEENQHQDPA